MSGYFQKYPSILITLFVSTTVMLTLDDYGVTWDEVINFQGGRAYLDWLSSPSLSTIDRFWSVNSEHPPLSKILGGFTSWIFYEKLGWFEEHVAFRISRIFFIAPFTLAFFSFSRFYFGLWPAIFISVAFAFHPRIFFHSHIGALDYPMMSMWFLVFYALWRGERSGKWIVGGAVLMGLAFLTKINALTLYAVYGLFVLGKVAPKATLRGMKFKIGKLKITRILLFQICGFIFIPLFVFYLLWPWIWANPVDRTSDFISFHIHHPQIPTYYFGVRYLDAPWHIPPVLTFLTTPVFILGLFCVGSFSKVLPWKVRGFVMANLFLAWVIISMSPSKHDGVRLFLPAFPFFYLIAAAGLVTTFEFLKKRTRGWTTKNVELKLSTVIGILLAFALLLSVVRYHPYQTAYFNSIVGGDRGAAVHGFEYHYWCSSYLEAFDWLEERAESKFWVPSCAHLFDYYHSAGLLKKKLQMTSEKEADYLILLPRYGSFDENFRNYFRNKKPEFSVKAYEESVLGIYRNTK